MKKDKLFDELLELSAKVKEITLTDDMRKLFGDEHISANGSLVLASFLPVEIQTEFYKYMSLVAKNQNAITFDDLNWWTYDDLNWWT